MSIRSYLVAPVLVAPILLGLALAHAQDTEKSKERPFCSLAKPLKDILLAADEIELLSLDPSAKHPLLSNEENRRKAKEAKQKIRDWPVLGSTKISDKAVQKKLVEELEKSIAACTPLHMALCFQPRHALRAMAGGKTVELLICFECWRVHPYHDGMPTGGVATNDSPKVLFNDLLKAAKVPLASEPPKRDEKKELEALTEEAVNAIQTRKAAAKKQP